MQNQLQFTFVKWKRWRTNETSWKMIIWKGHDDLQRFNLHALWDQPDGKFEISQIYDGSTKNDSSAFRSAERAVNFRNFISPRVLKRAAGRRRSHDRIADAGRSCRSRFEHVKYLSFGSSSDHAKWINANDDRQTPVIFKFIVDSTVFFIHSPLLN